MAKQTGKPSIKKVVSVKKDTAKFTKEQSLRMSPKQLDAFISKTSKAGGNVQKALDARRKKVVKDSLTMDRINKKPIKK